MESAHFNLLQSDGKQHSHHNCARKTWCVGLGCCEVFVAAVVGGCAPPEVADGFSESAWNVVSLGPVVDGPCGGGGCLGVVPVCSECGLENPVSAVHAVNPDHDGVG